MERKRICKNGHRHPGGLYSVPLMQFVSDSLKRGRCVGACVAQSLGCLVDTGFQDLHTVDDAVLGKGCKLDERGKIGDGAFEPAPPRPTIRVFGISGQDTEF